MKIEPSKDTLVLEKVEHVTQSGIYISRSEKETKFPAKGKVIAIGEGALPIPIKVGDIVFYEQYAEHVISVTADTELMFIRFEKLLGKVV